MKDFNYEQLVKEYFDNGGKVTVGLCALAQGSEAHPTTRETVTKQRRAERKARRLAAKEAKG